MSRTKRKFDEIVAFAEIENDFTLLRLVGAASGACAVVSGGIDLCLRHEFAVQSFNDTACHRELAAKRPSDHPFRYN